MKLRLRLPPRRQQGAWRRTLLWVGGALALLALLWTLGVGWWLPRLLQPRIEAAASEALGAPLRIAQLEIAPWALRARATGVRLGPEDAPWLRVAELVADVSSESAWRLAPVLERVSIREPQLLLERQAPGRFNVTPLLDALGRRTPAPADDRPARFALHNIRLENGRIQLNDRVTRTEHRIEALQVGVPFVSTLPSQVAIDVEPLLDARVDGSRLHVQGKTQPFTTGQRSSIDVNWQALDVAAWVAALKPLLSQALPVDVQRGSLDLALQLSFERRDGSALPLLRIAGGATLAQLQLAAPSQASTMGWERLAIDGLDLRPLERSAIVGSVKLQAPRAEVDLEKLLAPRPRTDRLSLSDPSVAPTPAAAAASSPAASAGGDWRWRVGRFELADGRLLLREPAWPQGQAVAPIALRIEGLDGGPQAAPATLALSLADEQGAKLQFDGTLAVAARQATLKATVEGLRLLPWLAPWQASLPVRVLDATAAFQAQAQAGPQGWSVQGGGLQLVGLQLQPIGRVASSKTAVADRLGLTRLEVSGVELDAPAQGAPSARIASVHLDGLNLKATRSEQGVVAWQPAPSAAGSSAGSAADGAALPAGSPGWRWQVGELRCSGCALAFTDRSVQPAASFGVARTELKVQRIDSDPTQTLNFELAAQSLGGGRVQAKGRVRPQPLVLNSQLRIDALDLRALQPYIESRANLSLASAKALAAGELRVEGSAREAVSQVQWRGRLGLAELRALDQLNRAEFLRFKSLVLDDAALRWQPAALEADLGAVALDGFYGRVIVNADGRLNLFDIARRDGQAGPRSLTTPGVAAPSAAPASTTEPPAAASAVAASPASTAAPGPVAAASPPQLRWRGIRLGSGEVDFTDNFIRPNYSARLTDIDGSVSALAWNDPRPATVKVSGKVDGSAPLEIDGTVHPLGPRLATDLTASARGIDITRLSAYSGRYAGYGIEKGTLSVKVHYKIENGKLEASNNLYLDQLTFGDKVDSPNALKLPVLLAVSLLKDRNGVIDIDLPISGSLDDPQFSIGGIIVRVIVNLITKAITAPFSLLANAFGGGGQELGYVEFAPGSTELDDASRQRLDTLAKALADRPALKLEATGRADPAVDTVALRQQRLDRLMRIAKAKSTGELPESVRIDAAERTRWLEAAYKAADLKDKPRNFIGLAKSVPPAEMETRLLDSVPVGDEALRALADQRGNRVKAYLTTKVAPERVLLTASRLDAEGLQDQGRTSRVAFAVK